MTKEFIPYEQALALKELEFNEPCFAYYEVNHLIKNNYRLRFVEHEETNPLLNNSKSNNITAPLYQQAFRWFREKYGLHPHFCFFTDEKLWNVDIYAYLKEYGLKTDPCTMKFKTYEEAEYACLNKLIEIVKKK